MQNRQKKKKNKQKINKKMKNYLQQKCYFKYR